MIRLPTCESWLGFGNHMYSSYIQTYGVSLYIIAEM